MSDPNEMWKKVRLWVALTVDGDCVFFFSFVWSKTLQ